MKVKPAHLLLLAVLVIVLPLLLHASVPRGNTVRVEGENIRVLRGGDYLEHFYLQILPSAEERIWIVTYSLSRADTRRMQSVYDKLQEKHEQGVDVRLLMAEELDRNRKIYRALKEKYDFKVKMYEGDRTMHVKTILVDDKHIYSGSANFTLTGFGRPSESTIYLRSKKFVRQVERNIDNLWEAQI